MHPLLFSLGHFTVASYGVLAALAYLTAILWLKSKRPRMDLGEDEFWRLVYAVFFGALLGGKLLYLALEWHEHPGGPFSIIGSLRYGFVFYGGLIGGMLGGILAMRRARQDKLRVADYFATALPMGHWIGRLGCFMAGCCYGRPSSLPWAVAFPEKPLTIIPPYLWGIPIHPTQLYESAYELALCLISVFFILPAIERGRLKSGTALWSYLLLYSAARFLNEFLRGDDRGGFWLSLSISQWLALAFAALSLAALWKQGLRIKKGT